jgi:hypothetical protein
LPHHRLDAATGRQRWSYVTDAPVRFAPAIWKDRAFAVSDDGYLYCLSLADGPMIHRGGGRTDDFVLGNSRMVSRWPPAAARSFARESFIRAGIWQSGAFTSTPSTPNRDARFGRTTRRAKSTCRSCTALKARWPRAASRAQGYLVATADELLVPTGRAVPAAFSQ